MNARFIMRMCIGTCTDTMEKIIYEYIQSESLYLASMYYFIHTDILESCKIEK